MNKNFNYTASAITVSSARQPKTGKMLVFVTLIYLLIIVSCKKLVEIPPPAATITSSQTFSTDVLATSAMLGVYHKMINSDGDNFSNGAISIYTGVSADELNFFLLDITDNAEFQFNNLTSPNGRITSSYWENGFSIIYSANSILEGLRSASNVGDSVKNELTGEAKFVRAFCNFYLCNLFGNIPLVNETNWRNTNLLGRTPVSQVYQHIIADLKDAQNLLAADFSVSNGQKIIPTKWAASALLARIYLYTNDWINAEMQADSVILNSGFFSINANLNDVFKVNSSEAIWQLQQSNTIFPYNATREGERILPVNSTEQPFIYITEYLLNSFEPNDKRKASWIDSTIFSSVKYYYPKKYEIGPSQRTPNGPYSEYYMVLRLAEQYLIRAEARAEQGKLTEAISDLNIIRQRADLAALPNTLTQQQVLDAISRERRVELFAEWSHRWFDLKRWGLADAVLAPIKGSNWQATDQLYPIPQNDLLTNPNLTQNPGY